MSSLVNTAQIVHIVTDIVLYGTMIFVYNRKINQQKETIDILEKKFNYLNDKIVTIESFLNKAPEPQPQPLPLPQNQIQSIPQPLTITQTPPITSEIVTENNMENMVVFDYNNKEKTKVNEVDLDKEIQEELAELEEK